jgi:uncharacterized protein (DUF927 family)
VKAFFEAYGASRFENADAEHPAADQRINSRAGFYRLNAKEQREYLVLPEVFASEVCKGFDLKAAAKVLKAHEWLIPSNDGKSAQKPRLPGIGPTRVYVIGGELWEHES